MNNLMDSLPSSLRSWFNGLESLTMSQIDRAEREWQISLLGYYVDGTWTREEANEAWGTWQQMKADEIAYLEAA